MEEEVIEQLKQGYTFSEIQESMSLTSEDYLSLLKKINYGIKENIVNKLFFSDGTFFNINKKEKEDFSVITRSDEDIFHYAVISDTHIGSNDDNISYLDLVYDYCIKNNINYLFHGGDLIDGTHGNKEKRLYLNDQIEEVIEKYPYDESITNIINLGNHDFDSIAFDMPIDEALLKYRHDMIPIGYGTNEVNLKNDSFVMNHFIPIDKTDKNFTRKLILRGHSHRFKTQDDHNNFTVSIPALSDMDFPDHFVPGFLDITIVFRKGYCDEVLIKFLGIINNRIYPLGLSQKYIGYKIPPKDLQNNVLEYKKRR
jgi:hypothetical protein